MKPSEIDALIVARFNAGIKRPILIEGSPGLGKTQIAAQAAKKLGVEFKAIHAPLLQPEDYGFPVISKDRDDVSFIVSKDKFPIEGAPYGARGIFLIDDIGQCDGPTQKILRNLILEREIHGKRLMEGWTIVATGNRTTDRAGSNRLLSHLSNALTRVPMEASLDDWTNWALVNGVKPEVISFIRFRPDLLTNFDPQNEINATPRAWAQGVSEALGVIDPSMEFPVFCGDVGPERNETRSGAVFCGDVGEGPASEFLGFLRVFRTLPSPDLILVNPDKAQVPDDPATLYALCGALAYRTTADNFGRLMTYIGRLPAEFGVLYVRDALARKPEIANSKAFIQWAAGDGAKLLT